MSEIRATTSVRRLANGKEVTFKVECSQGDAEQEYRGKDSEGKDIVTPDWTTDDSERPIFWCNVLSNKTRIIYTDDKWMYNATSLTFDNNGLSNNPGLVGTFLKLTYSGVPSLKIMKNLASEDNQDNDNIYLDFAYKSGKIDSRATVNFGISIKKAATDVYKGTIIPIDDEGFTIKENGGKIQAHARLRYGGVIVPIDKYKVKWMIQNGGILEPLRDENGALVVDPSSHTITVTADMIPSCLNLYAIFTDLNGVELSSDTQGLLDYSDPLSINKNAVPANETIIEDSDVVVYTPNVVDSDGNIKTEFAGKFKFFLSKQDGTKIIGDYDNSTVASSSQTITANDVDRADPGDLQIEIVADSTY